MLRDLIINGAKAPDAMHKAKTDMVTGMAVIKKDTATEKTVEKVGGEETTANIFFVDKERIPSGCNAARTDVSDYDPDFVNIKTGEFVTVDKYAPGERFATDQYDDAQLTDGTAIDTLVAFKDGKATKATGETVSMYLFKGIYDDNGHKLARIEVSDTAAKASE